MPRKYVHQLGTRSNCNYDDKLLPIALKMVEDRKCTLTHAAKKFEIPKTTLYRHLKRGKELKKYGGQTVLNQDEEESLVHGILVAAKWGYPFTKPCIRNLVKGYLDHQKKRCIKFKKNFPGRQWCDDFLKRHASILSVRLGQNIKLSRASIDQDIVSAFFANLKDDIAGIPPSNILNFDETNFTDDPGRVKVVVKRGSKRPNNIIDTSMASISVMMAAAADGTILPPYVVYKSKEMWDTWTEGGPPGTRYNHTASGWFDTKCFEDWFFNIAIKYFRKLDGKKLVICDNVSSHLSHKVIVECEKRDIFFKFLPANSTHMLQPLDVSFFRKVKGEWRKVLMAWKKSTKGCISKDAFPGLLADTLKNCDITNKSGREVVQSGFRACGIHPFNPSLILKKFPQLPSEQDSSKTSWSHTFENLLKEERFSKNKNQLRRRKKLRVAPGASVRSKDLQSEEDSDVDNDLMSLPSTSSAPPPPPPPPPPSLEANCRSRRMSLRPTKTPVKYSS